MKDCYESPLGARYASRRMLYIFSPDFKFSTWRRLWLALAESEKALGLPITQEQLTQMRAHLDDIDYEAAERYERALRHDVMAHVHAFGDQCPAAKPIIHLGATSCYVGDNTDVIQLREGLKQIRHLLLGTLQALHDFILCQADTPTLAYTHFQAAQPTTVGKRAALWAQDFAMDLQRLDFELSNLKLLGCRGATGTAASFLELFHGDRDKVEALEGMIAEKMGFAACMPVSGQTYSRKVDAFVVGVLSGIAQSAYKMADDLRLMAHLKAFDEPFEQQQIGSSAMAYKRNPMRCERICSLARFVMNDAMNPVQTAATQWLERTLDDSANRRLALPEAFLATDAILSLCTNVIAHGRVYPGVLKSQLMEELPFIASENILMRAVENGGDRQALHEKIRRYSVETAREVKENGGKNDLLERLMADADFGLTPETLAEILDIGKFLGCAPEQARRFAQTVLAPILKENILDVGTEEAIRV